VAAGATLLGLLACASCNTQIGYPPGEPWADPTPYPTIGNGKLIVFNTGDDTLSWIDVDTLAPVFSDTVGLSPPELESPHDGTALPDGSAFFVSFSNYAPGSGTGPHGAHGTGNVDGYLLEYDMQTHALIGRTELAHNAAEVTMTADGRILVTHFDLRLIQDQLATNPNATYDDLSSTVAIIDPAAMSPTDPSAGLVKSLKVCPAEHGIIASQDGKTAFVTCYASDELAVVSLDPPYAVQRYPLGTGTFSPASPLIGPFVLEQSPSDGTIWVSTLGPSGGTRGDIRVFDPAANAWDSRGPIQMDGMPFDGTFTTDGTQYIVCDQIANSLVFIDTATHAIASRLALPLAECENPRVPALMPDGLHVVVVCEGDHFGPGTVAVVRLGATPVLESHYTVGVYPGEAVLVTEAP
jgi:DNA-binding beta-propeller fold protein YncE